MKKMIVMGGSFNPPTIAHFKMMQYAVKTLDAEKGIFVPVSYAYLKRKMRGLENKEICLKEEERLRMLNMMCQDTKELCTDDIEMRFPKMQTCQTMERLQEKYPEYQLYFLAGSDKLKMMKSWVRNSDFFEKYWVLLVYREEQNPEEVVLQDELLKIYRNRFVFLALPEKVDTISSTMIRRAFVKRETDKVRDALHPAVWELFRKLDPDQFPKEIERFEDEHEYLNNKYPVPFLWKDQIWNCAETAYQASRCEDWSDAARLVNCSAEKAKKMAARVKQKEDCREEKLQTMEEILRAKFMQNPQLKIKLEATGNTILIAGSSKKETFWGRNLYTGQGENQLGMLLMKLRSEFVGK